MRTLFINPGGIGDQILFLPTVKLFKENFSGYEIDLICEPRSAVIGELTNLYRKIKPYDFKEISPNIFKLRELIRARNYKYLFLTGSSYKANLISLLSNAEFKIGFHKGIFSRLCLTNSVKLNKNQYAANMFANLLTPIVSGLERRINAEPLLPEIKLTPASIEWAKETLSPRIKERYFAKKIFIHPGVSKLSVKKNILKSWGAKHWAKLIEKLLENQDNTVILVGGKDDSETIAEIYKKLSFFTKPKNFLDFSSLDLSIDKLCALINSSDLLVCVDSAPMHLAVGLGKKLVAFFGPTDPKKLLPADPRFISVHVDNLECRPCLFDKRKESCSTPKCLEVTPELMLNAIQKQLESGVSG